jgi:hypothetical protein
MIHTPTSPTVAVIGAGPAGIAAAVAVTRQGGRAVLIDSAQRVGGSATNAMVGTVCGLSECSPNLTTDPTCDNPGFAKEFALELMKLSSSSIVRNKYGLSYLSYSPGNFEKVALHFLSDSNIQVLLSTPLLAIKKAPTREFFVEVSNTKLLCNAVIDCSGDAVALQALGHPVEIPEQYQANAQIFSVAGLPTLAEEELALLIRKRLREAVLAKKLPEHCSYISMVPGTLRDGIASLKFACSSSVEMLDTVEQRISEERISQDLLQALDVLRGSDERFSHTILSTVAPTLGVRSGRRGIGTARLEKEMVVGSQRSPDGVALGFWPIELWSTPIRPEIIFPDTGRCYEIPLGALCSALHSGVYFAGRCIFASDAAIASARVMGTCLSTGYAAGRAAIGFARDEEKTSIVSALREEQVEPYYGRLRQTAQNNSCK